MNKCFVCIKCGSKITDADAIKYDCMCKHCYEDHQKEIEKNYNDLFEYLDDVFGY